MDLDTSLLNGVKVFAFIGPAGTGKSYRAQYVASLLDADYIIDDGLIIHKGSIVCGKSAKSERNQVSAIRRALFEFNDHKEEVISFFCAHQPCSVMLIATSDTMVTRILRKLGLNDPERIIRINEIATEEEISKARTERFSKGQHVIPVSHVLVRKNFAGKLVGQLRVFWKSRNQAEGEKTIVRPPFSFLGNVHIEPEALEQLINFVATRSEQVVKIEEIDISAMEESIVIQIKLKMQIGELNFITLAKSLKNRVGASVKYFTGLDVKKVDIIVSEVLI
ncbi:MAG: hypothetical protein RR203_02930 [Synergistaceae bacterium]